MSKLNDLSDLTILILIRLDTIERLENVLALCRYLSSNFETNILVSEYASYNNGMLAKLLDKNIRYSFHEDHDPVFKRNRFLVQLAKAIATPFLAVWDADTIIPTSQLEKAIEILRKEKADFINPYQEPVVDTTSILKRFYYQENRVEVSSQNLEEVEIKRFSNTLDKVFIFNRMICFDTDAENTNFYGWGRENDQRHGEWKNLECKRQSIPGALFHLSHGRRRNLGKLILHFNTPEMTERLCQMVPGAIVIDNGSTEHPYLGANRCVRQENLGFTEGWNRAVRALWNEFDTFWLMNSDIVIEPESVKRVEWIASAYPDIGFFTPAYNCWMKHCRPVPNEGLTEVSLMEFTAPVISRKVFETIGFFDKLFAKGYGVDFDFCYRAKQAGIPMYVDHNSCFFHLGHQTIIKHEGMQKYSNEAMRELVTGLTFKYGPSYKESVFNGLNFTPDSDRT